jgi:hypothetical protein
VRGRDREIRILILTRVADGGADELAGDSAAEELGDAVNEGAGDAVDVEDVLAHEHHVALEVGMLVGARQVVDDRDLHAEHLRSIVSRSVLLLTPAGRQCKPLLAGYQIYINWSGCCVRDLSLGERAIYTAGEDESWGG